VNPAADRQRSDPLVKRLLMLLIYFHSIIRLSPGAIYSWLWIGNSHGSPFPKDVINTHFFGYEVSQIRTILLTLDLLPA
jgi:hypothetical protein